MNNWGLFSNDQAEANKQFLVQGHNYEVVHDMSGFATQNTAQQYIDWYVRLEEDDRLTMLERMKELSNNSTQFPDYESLILNYAQTLNSTLAFLLTAVLLKRSKLLDVILLQKLFEFTNVPYIN